MKIAARVYSLMLHEARAAWPCECCGILLAAERSPQSIAMLMPSRNMAGQCRQRRYRLDYKVQLAALQLEQSGSARVVGYYHSHPDGEPGFSSEDARWAVEEAVYLIIGGSLDALKVRAWKCGGAGYEEEPLEQDQQEEGPEPCWEPIHYRNRSLTI